MISAGGHMTKLTNQREGLGTGRLGHPVQFVDGDVEIKKKFQNRSRDGSCRRSLK